MALRAFIALLVVTVVNCSTYKCDKTYTAESGEIRSPGSSSYPNNANCTYIIKGSPRIRTVEFTFESFRTEGGYDSLSFGKYKYSGSQPKGKKLNYTFSDSFTLRFTSDESVSHQGFVIKYNLKPGCPEGKYGFNCNNDCYPGCNLETCKWKSGYCDCKPGLTGSKCNHECRAGHYGQDCSSRCSSGCSDVCNRETGRCTCKPGKTGTKCDAEFSSVCPSGTYGAYCSKACSPGCEDRFCNKEDGNCSCKPGYKGSRCDQECSRSRYGLNRSKQCSPGCSDMCSTVDGECTCRAGWEGPKCDAECDNSTYGVYCMQKCSDGCVNDTCNSITGTCSCISGYIGDRCSFNVILIDVVSAGVLAAILIPVSVYVLILSGRKKKKQESILKKTTKISDALSVKNISQDYVNYDEDALYIHPIHVSEREKETVTYSDGQTSVSHSARNTDHTNEDSLYENVHFSCNNRGKDETIKLNDDTEEDID